MLLRKIVPHVWMSSDNTGLNVRLPLCIPCCGISTRSWSSSYRCATDLAACNARLLIAMRQLWRQRQHLTGGYPNAGAPPGAAAAAAAGAAAGAAGAALPWQLATHAWSTSNGKPRMVGRSVFMKYDVSTGSGTASIAANWNWVLVSAGKVASRLAIVQPGLLYQCTSATAVKTGRKQWQCGRYTVRKQHHKCGWSIIHVCRHAYVP